MKLLYSLPLLGLSLPPVALANSGFHYLNHKRAINTLFERQTRFCGQGATCAEACGAGYVQCGDSSSDCYNPTAGETCCGASGYYCPSGEYCADSGGDCCTNGQDLGSCAASLGITLSPSTAIQTSTASGTPVPAPVTTSTYVPPAQTALPTSSVAPVPTTPPATSVAPAQTTLPATSFAPAQTTLPASSFAPLSTSSAASSVFTGAAVKMDAGVAGKLLVAVLGLAGAL